MGSSSKYPPFPCSYDFECQFYCQAKLTTTEIIIHAEIWRIRCFFFVFRVCVSLCSLLWLLFCLPLTLSLPLPHDSRSVLFFILYFGSSMFSFGGALHTHTTMAEIHAYRFEYVSIMCIIRFLDRIFFCWSSFCLFRSFKKKK